MVTIENKPEDRRPEAVERGGSTQARWRSAGLILRFLSRRLVLITATIFIGVFLTVLMVNQPIDYGLYIKPPQLDAAVDTSIERYLYYYRFQDPSFWTMNFDRQQKVLEDLRTSLHEEYGVNLPYLQRHLLWTYNALKFDWGRLKVLDIATVPFFKREGRNIDLNSILLSYFPSTLLLAGASILLIFIIGLPLSLWLSSRYGSRLDRLFGVLAPISSVPSWVIGLLLLFIFAVELKVLPYGGLLDNRPPEQPIGYVWIIAKHMILPVAAIIISLLFQLVYSWRTYFVIFAEEDYVDLGKAVGLAPRALRRKYILKPALTYIITSFSLMLVSFWQMTIVLEVVFNWPGIGWLYVNIGLPNFWGESMYPGELLVALQLVVIFAYLLGSIVFLLDIVYVIVDPRINMELAEPGLRLIRRRRRRRKGAPVFELPGLPEDHTTDTRWIRPKSSLTANLRLRLRGMGAWLKRAAYEVRRYPSAVFGLIVILLLIAGSLYAVIGLPYRRIGTEWGRANLTGRAEVPKVAKPVWVNFFRSTDYLSTLSLDSAAGDAERVESAFMNGMRQITLTYRFDYSYAEIPSEVFLYLDGSYTVKRSFIVTTWLTPDGREIKFKNRSVGPGEQFDLEESLPYKRMVNDNLNWQEWFVFGQIFPTPAHYVLFADPNADEPRVVPGTYTLVIEGLTFEEDSDIQARLLMLGQVYGAAGTDIYRRDLLVPLLWGMPFALLFGLMGSLATTLLSMILAASGVWFGGWVDNLVQRLTDINLVLPILAICVLAVAYLHVSVWVVLGVIVLLNVFGSPTKTFRSAFLQIKNAPYVEAAQAYGAGSRRIIRKYLVPRILPVMIPQLVILIPGFVFLEATLGMFNINTGYPTWGTIIYQAMTHGALYGSRYWVMQPLALLLLTGLAFSMFGAALERILNPRLQND